MSIITITRGQYSGGEEVAESIAKALGARCVSDEVLREAAKSFQLSEGKLDQFFDKNPTLWERITKSQHIYAAYIRATLMEMCADNNLVYHGNAGQELLREIPHALKVRLMLSVELRVNRMMELFGYDRKKAEQMVAQVDDDRTRRTQYYYQADWRDSSRYDLMIRMNAVSHEFVEHVILEMAKEPAFQLTDEKARVLRDVRFKSRINALAATILGNHFYLLNVTVHDGTVELSGTFPGTAAMKIDTLFEEISAAEGVLHIDNKISAGLVALTRQAGKRQQA